MKDTRVKSLQTALKRLADSLDATVRLKRWEPTEAVPEPLSRLALDLPGRLDLASRLAAGTFLSSSADAARVDAMRVATERLAAAYGAYRGNPDLANDERSAAIVLEEEIGQVRSDTMAW
jgi:hypothetical protein